MSEGVLVKFELWDPWTRDAADVNSVSTVCSPETLVLVICFREVSDGERVGDCGWR